MRGWEAEASDHQESEDGLQGQVQIPCLNYCPYRAFVGFIFPPLEIFHELCPSYAKRKRNRKTQTKNNVKKNSCGQNSLGKLEWTKEKLMSLLKDFPRPEIGFCTLWIPKNNCRVSYIRRETTTHQHTGDLSGHFSNSSNWVGTVFFSPDCWFLWILPRRWTWDRVGQGYPTFLFAVWF